MRIESRHFWIFLASLVLMLVLAPLRAISVQIAMNDVLQLNTLVYFVAYFFLTYFFLKKYDGTLGAWGIVIALILGTSALDIPLRINADDFMMRIGSFLEYVMRIVAILLALLYYKTADKKWRVAVLSASTVLVLWVSFFGYKTWEDMIAPLSEAASEERSIALPMLITTSSGESIDVVTDKKGKILVLPVWKTDSKKSVEDLAEMQKLWDRYKNNPEVEFLSLLCNDGSDKPLATANEILAAKGYNFPVALVERKDIRKQVHNPWLNLPLLMIIAKDGRFISISPNAVFGSGGIDEGSYHLIDKHAVNDNGHN